MMILRLPTTKAINASEKKPMISLGLRISVRELP
jgi:hypothetical protein